MDKLQGIMKKLSPEDRAVLKEYINLDGLTQAFNRRKFNVDLQRFISKVERTDKDVTLIMMDIDNFKLYNDTKGHLEGDRILVEVSSCVMKHLRRHECNLYRYGGEEFAVIIPDSKMEGGSAPSIQMRKQKPLVEKYSRRAFCPCDPLPQKEHNAFYPR